MSRIFIDVRIGRHMMSSPRVVDFPKASPEGAAKITDRETIEVKFTYPLNNPVTKTFTNPGGFTAYDFLKVVNETYTTIYREEEEAAGNPGHVPGMLNRAESHGPHGIWGHDMSDLFLEGVFDHGDGRFGLVIGS
jgi:hypothetical protein